MIPAVTAGSQPVAELGRAANNERSLPASGRTLAYAVVLMVILAAGLKLTFGLENVFDVPLTDDTQYLRQGVELTEKGLPPADWAPLYVAWFHALSYLQPDRLKLFYLNTKLLMVMLPVAFAVLLIRLRVHPLAVLALTTLCMISCGNAPGVPKVGAWGAIAVLCAFACPGWSAPAKALPVAASGALLASLVRPEFVYAFWLLLLVYAVVLALEWRARRLGWGDASAVAALALFVLLVGLTVGLPGRGGPEDRVFYAFGQHFAWNYSKWQSLNHNFWTEWTSIVKTAFGDVHSVGDAWRANPELFLKHVSSNARALLPAICNLLSPKFIQLLPRLTVFQSDEGLIFAGAFLIYVVLARKAWSRGLRERLRAHWPLLATAAAFTAPSLVSALLIAPEIWYLLPPCLVWLAVLAWVFCRGDPAARMRPAAMLAPTALALALVPCVWGYYAGPSGRMPPCENVSTIASLRALKTAGDVNLLTTWVGMPVYTGDRVRLVSAWDKQVGFAQFLEQRHVGVILIDRDLKDDIRFRDDPEWLRFLADPAAFGFAVAPIPGTPRLLALRRDIAALQ